MVSITSLSPTGTFTYAQKCLSEGQDADAVTALIGGSERFSGRYVVEFCEEIRSLIESSESDEAQRRLDRWLNPKWRTYAACVTAYDAAMAQKRGAA